MLVTYPDNLNGGSCHVHLHLEAAVLVIANKPVVEGHGGFQGEIAPAFEEGELVTLRPTAAPCSCTTFPKGSASSPEGYSP
jgi:hypothetical protein